MGSTRPNPTYVGWVRLDVCDGLGWVEFFFTHHGGLGQKIRSTRPMHTPISNHWGCDSIPNVRTCTPPSILG